MNNGLLKRYIAEIAKQDEIKKQIESLRGQIDVLIQLLMPQLHLR